MEWEVAHPGKGGPEEYHLAFLCRYEQVINVRNFALKFQDVAQKMANNLWIYFLPHPVYCGV